MECRLAGARLGIKSCLLRWCRQKQSTSNAEYSRVLPYCYGESESQMARCKSMYSVCGGRGGALVYSLVDDRAWRVSVSFNTSMTSCSVKKNNLVRTRLE